MFPLNYGLPSALLISVLSLLVRADDTTDSSAATSTDSSAASSTAIPLSRQIVEFQSASGTGGMDWGTVVFDHDLFINWVDSTDDFSIWNVYLLSGSNSTENTLPDDATFVSPLFTNVFGTDNITWTPTNYTLIQDQKINPDPTDNNLPTATYPHATLQTGLFYQVAITPNGTVGNNAISPSFKIINGSAIAAGATTTSATSVAVATSSGSVATSGAVMTTGAPNQTQTAAPTTGLSTGAKAGVGVTVPLAFISIVSGCAWFLLRRKRKGEEAKGMLDAEKGERNELEAGDASGHGGKPELDGSTVQPKEMDGGFLGVGRFGSGKSGRSGRSGVSAVGSEGNAVVSEMDVPISDRGSMLVHQVNEEPAELPSHG